MTVEGQRGDGVRLNSTSAARRIPIWAARALLTVVLAAVTVVLTLTSLTALLGSQEIAHIVSVEREDDACIATIQWQESDGRTYSGAMECPEITEVGAPVNVYVWGSQVLIGRADAILGTAFLGLLWVATLLVTVRQYRSDTPI